MDLRLIAQTRVEVELCEALMRVSYRISSRGHAALWNVALQFCACCENLSPRFYEAFITACCAHPNCQPKSPSPDFRTWDVRFLR